ncbi:MAG: hypothetical protein P8X90_31500 [Desulfobacterales bacterium]
MEKSLLTVIDAHVHCGHERLLFGSDFPFGSPSNELRKIYRLELEPAVEAAVLGGNFMRLQDARASAP